MTESEFIADLLTKGAGFFGVNCVDAYPVENARACKMKGRPEWIGAALHQAWPGWESLGDVGQVSPVVP